MAKVWICALSIIGLAPGVALGEPAAATAGGPVGAPDAAVTAPTEPTLPAAEPGQRLFGLGPELGVLGAGAALHVGSPAFGLYAGGSYAPIVVFQKSDVRLFGAGDVRVDGYAYAAKTPHGTFGALGGLSYNSLLGTGFNLGAGGTVRLARSVDLSLRWVFAFYPDARARLASHLDATQGDPTAPWAQGGAEIGLLFYP